MSDSNSKHVESDLSYVRSVVDRSERGPSPAPIYLLWAAIVLVGFPLADFAPAYVGVYWTIMGPLGGVISGVLGWRHSVRLGQVSREIGRRHALHWGGMLAAIFSVVVLGITNTVAWEVVHRIILLVIALAYFLAGVHLDRPLLWVGMLVAVAYFVMFFVTTYAWTIVGVVVSAALVVAAFAGGRERA